MSDKMKKILIYSTVGLASMVLLLGFIVGKWNESNSKENNADANKVTHQYKEKDRGDETIDGGGSSDKNMGVNNPYGENYAGYEKITPSKVDKSKLPKSYKQMYDTQDVATTKKTAESFIRVFYNFTDTDLRKYVKKSKKYMTDELYQKAMDSPESVQADKIKRRLVTVEMIEPNKKPPKGKGIIWVARVHGKVTGMDENVRDVTDDYLLYLEKKKDKWKISDYMVNVPF